MNHALTLAKTVATTFLGLLFSTALLATNGNTVFVDLNASGNNDGTSWDDAYTELQPALDAALPGSQIWVAEGVYLPGTDSLAAFELYTDVQLLGGFNGTEFSADQRDPDQYLTYLSGDLLQDDEPGDFENFRSDNAQTVLILGIDLTPNAVVDGFVIVGGYADGDDSEYHHRRGGGIFSYGRATVSGCVFQDNYADAGGGGMYYQGVGASGSTMQLCVFEGNEAEDGGGLMVGYLQEEGLELTACTFANNRARSDGGAIKNYNSHLFLTDNTFFQNSSERNGGGVEVQYQGYNFETTITDCTFEGNLASRGGGLRFDASFGLGVSFNGLQVQNCDFIQNGATLVDPDYGGGFLAGGVSVNLGATTSFTNVTFSGCDFEGNFSDGRGAAMTFDLQGVDNTLVLEGMYWNDNITSDNGVVDINTSAIASGTFTIVQSGFEDNSSAGNAGGLSIRASQAAQMDFFLTDVAFFSNAGSFSAGAFRLTTREGGSINLLADGCSFLNNSSVGPGGALAMFGTNDGLNIHFLRCLFSENSSTEGSLMAGIPFDPGTGMPTGSSVVFDNCLISKHEAGSSVILLDSFPALELINTTFAENAGTLLSLINESSLQLENTILEEPQGAAVFEDLSDDGQIVSTGGNIIGDDSLDDWVEGSDKSGVDPSLDPMSSFPYELESGSPAIDAGVAPLDPPALDLFGNVRVQGGGIDAGAIESAFVSSTSETTIATFSANLFPNPARVQSSLLLQNRAADNLTIKVFTMDGREVYSRVVDQSEGIQVYPLPLQEWVAGTYQVQISGEAYQQTIPLVVE